MDDESRTHILPDDDDLTQAFRPGAVHLIVIGGSCRGTVYDLDRDALVLGRKAPTSDLVLRSPRVSNPHCRIVRDAGRYSIEDLGSRNGTRVNQLRLEPERPRPLSHGDTVQIADQLLLFHQLGSFVDAQGDSTIRFDSDKVRCEVDAILADFPLGRDA